MEIGEERFFSGEPDHEQRFVLPIFENGPHARMFNRNIE
jgi:hypothetical protein